MNRDYPVNNKEDFVIELPSQVEWILKKLRDRGYEPLPWAAACGIPS